MPLSLSWQNLSVSQSPGPISRHCLAFDPDQNQTILFGGMQFRIAPNNYSSCRSLGNTWIFKDNQWAMLPRGKSDPLSLQRGAMVYDPMQKHCFLFGGQNVRGGINSLIGETFLFKNNAWEKLQKPEGEVPRKRYGHCMTYDDTEKEIMMFGGADRTSTLGDTWVFSGSYWKQLDGPSPPARRYAALAYDPQLKGCVLQGGCSDEKGDQPLLDTWLLKDYQWEKLSYPDLQQPRVDHSLFFDPRIKRLLMTPGKQAEGLLARTDEGWRRVRHLANEVPRQCSPVVFDSVRNTTLFFGGEDDAKQMEDTVLLAVEKS